MTLSYLAITSPDGEFVLSPDEFDPRETSYSVEDLEEDVRYRIMAIPKDTDAQLTISLMTSTGADQIVRDGDEWYLIPGEEMSNTIEITVENGESSKTYDIDVSGTQ